jgi:hypothetical protein
MTFERAATLYVEAHASGWRGANHAVQWRTVMQVYAYPVLGAINMDAVKHASCVAGEVSEERGY